MFELFLLLLLFFWIWVLQKSREATRYTFKFLYESKFYAPTIHFFA